MSPDDDRGGADEPQDQGDFQPWVDRRPSPPVEGGADDDEEFQPWVDRRPPPPPPSRAHARRQRHGSRLRGHPVRIALVSLLGLIVLALVGGYLWLDSEANPSGPKGAQVVVDVAPGTGISRFASELASKGVISSSLAYEIWIRLHGDPTLVSGHYAFNKNDSFGTVHDIVSGGPNVGTLDIPPGFTVEEIGTRLGEETAIDPARFDAVATSGAVHSSYQPAGSTNLDGVLGTGTYLVLPGETPKQLLTQMVDRFAAQADAAGVTAGAASVGLTPYQLITMASIVQKEGYIDKNMGPVARVVLNRLAAGMPLQMDSTVLYSLGQDGGTVTTKDLQLPSPYNTYLNKGLTPTPICFPSSTALKAAMAPPAGSWLFFVVVEKDGTEAFANTFAEQQANETLASQRGLS